MAAENVGVSDIKKISDEDRQFKVKAAIFLSGVSGISALIGFGATLASAKRQDPKHFGIGMTPTRELSETGASLALRALGWGTLYAFAGCGVLFYGIWKLSGAKNLQEFRYKMGSALPVIPRNNPPQGRTEFSGLNDLLDYLQHQKGVNDK
ncbi:transmembrane protein 242 [Diabrotica virgifera virgifera]|uniref:Transmembrane protein 242 n=1 Tax=Diabrotica virgifera virgifera TaxID=50390 RepID=A0A6P7F337_DIAVI|nr:transmembrane protein 242 [Diabrotica virgifera virgifera]